MNTQQSILYSVTNIIFVTFIFLTRKVHYKTQLFYIFEDFITNHSAGVWLTVNVSKVTKEVLTMNKFDLKAPYQPTGDQPQAIAERVKGFREGNQCQTLLGVTGSGKTYTMANVIQEVQKPTLIIAHNKTLAAQLYGEFKEFFPNNAVEYFVSYYDKGKK